MLLLAAITMVEGVLWAVSISQTSEVQVWGQRVCREYREDSPCWF